MSHREAYRPRLTDAIIARYLRIFGAVSVTGVMGCGKTWSSEERAASEVSIDNRMMGDLVRSDLAIALDGDRPRLIDEWQEVPELWDAVRHAVDLSGAPGQFILTGSSTPAWSEVHHSGAARIATVRMRPMSLFELGLSDGTVTLRDLFEGRFEPGPVETSLRTLAEAVCHGGWPSTLGLDATSARLFVGEYLEALIRRASADGPGSGDELRRVLHGIARNAGGSATLKTLARDAFAADGEPSGHERRRLRLWLDYLLDRYLVEELPGWEAPITSPGRLRTKPKRTLCDPALTAALLGVDESSLLSNQQLFGQLFEELCLRDLRIYLAADESMTGASLRYYRDTNGLEVDAVVELADGRWGAIEVKLAGTRAQEAERSLLRLARKVAANPAARNPEPSFLAVLVGATPYRYQTEAGVRVLPITCLGVR